MVKIIPRILFAIILACFAEEALAKESFLVHTGTWRSTMDGAPCHFGLTDPFNGQLNNGSGSQNQWQTYYATNLKKSHYQEELDINFACDKEEPFEKICAKMGVRFINGKWTLVPYFKSENPGGHIVIKTSTKITPRALFLSHPTQLVRFNSGLEH